MFNIKNLHFYLQYIHIYVINKRKMENLIFVQKFNFGKITFWKKKKRKICNISIWFLRRQKFTLLNVCVYAFTYFSFFLYIFIFRFYFSSVTNFPICMMWWMENYLKRCKIVTLFYRFGIQTEICQKLLNIINEHNLNVQYCLDFLKVF